MTTSPTRRPVKAATSVSASRGARGPAGVVGAQDFREHQHLNRQRLRGRDIRPGGPWPVGPRSHARVADLLLGGSSHEIPTR